MVCIGMLTLTKVIIYLSTLDPSLSSIVQFNSREDLIHEWYDNTEALTVSGEGRGRKFSAG